ncbi:glyoxalase [Endozoicomonas numazuensis]|uniref:Glyoxalase n=1 Tax=Endozoicomonas numazuensis TaxID=1137799 RepID=A0A081NM36_9GAMM|nr:glyoxalase [Endozoicomonas numazuensis]
MIDHIGFSVIDYQQSKEFYCKVLTPLGIERVMEVEGWAGLGAQKKPELWFGQGETPQNPMHLAFNAPDRSAVDKFYQLAIAAGAVDNGAPGIREIYHPDYYGAFVIDLNGHNLEAVCHSPE